ncbi:hypothetical protein ACIQW9_08190 [Herminiimonas sp. NPDC097707]|uniref:hypothetical protein n=1 Tax=Herminiimonas sp. NPDC097707 TaxID=3364007 RepID=UPI00383AE3E0
MAQANGEMLSKTVMQKLKTSDAARMSDGNRLPSSDGRSNRKIPQGSRFAGFF